MKALILAIQFMTRLPLPSIAATDADFARAIRWFPVAGLVVGACVAGAIWAGSHKDPWLAALLGLIAWVGMTGALHLDGLGDMADATGAAHGDPARLSAVLADPHIGSFGVAAIGLQLLAKLVLLRLLADSATLWVVIAVPMIARIGPLVWTLWLPALHEGLASRFRAGIGWFHIGLWGLLTLAACAFAPALLAAIIAILLWGWWVRRRIGGISGDTHGAGIEMVESALLFALVIAA